MADEVLESCLQNFRDYNMKSYLLMRSKLSSASAGLCAIDPTWTMENIGKALWTVAVLSANVAPFEPKDIENSSGKKRTRDRDMKEEQNEVMESKSERPEDQSDNEVRPPKVLTRTLSGRIRKEIERYGQET